MITLLQISLIQQCHRGYRSDTNHARQSQGPVHAEIDDQAHSEWEAAAEAGLGLLRQRLAVVFP